MTDTLLAIARHLARAFAPLTRGFSSLGELQSLMRRLGWNATSLPPAYAAVATEASELLTAAEALADGATIPEVLEVIESAGSLVGSISDLTVAPGGVDATVFLSELPERLVELLLVDHLALEVPQLFSFFEMTGVIVREDQPPVTGRPAYVRKRLRYAEIPKILREPLDLPRRVYGWGTNVLDFPLFAEHLQELLSTLGLLAGIGGVKAQLDKGLLAGAGERRASTALEVLFAELEVGAGVQYVGVQLVELPAITGGSAGLALLPLVPAAVGASIALSDTIDLDVRAGTDLTRQLALSLRPEGAKISYPYEPSTPPPTSGFGATLRYHPTEPVVFFGREAATRLELAGISASLDLELRGTAAEATIGAELQGLAVVIAPGEGDAFLREVLGSGELRAEAPLRLRWSSARGLELTGGIGLQVAIQPHLRLGPITVDAVNLNLEGDGDAVSLRSTVDLALQLGPINASAMGLGLELAMKFEDGNAGPFGVDYRFVPPTGVAVSMSTDAVRLGGFLEVDAEGGFYAGVVEVSIKDILDLTAIGLINAPIPGTDSGFSLLFVVSTEFTPIQLGLGFTLNGVGGLLGWNRTADVEVLRAGVRSGALDNILFPPDPVRNISRIVGDLSAAFPAKTDQFVAGIMAKIGWGTPTLITADLGVVLELPDPVRLLILGVIRATLPNEDDTVLKLQVSLLGVVDFSAGTASFDAALYESRLLSIVLEGEMAFRLRWKGGSYFLLSVGGFHPQYQEAGGNLPVLRRLSIDVIPGDNPRLRAECYFAVTSNTVQLGAHAEFYAGVGPFNVYGWVHFDALFQRTPFTFSFACSAGFSIRAGSEPLWGISVNLKVSGPTPWHVHGTGEYSLLFLTITLSVDLRWGEQPALAQPPLALAPLIVAGLADNKNWSAELPSRTTTSVILRELTAAELSSSDVRIHPFGTLTVRQKVAPLGVALGNYQGAALSDGPTYEITAVQVGTQPLLITADSALRDEFAPAQYFSLTDSEKLSRPSFEAHRSGVRAGAASGLRVGHGLRRTIVFEEIVRDRVVTPDDRASVGAFAMTAQRSRAATAGGSAGRSRQAEHARKAGSAIGPARVVLERESYSVVEKATMVRVGSAYASYVEAVHALKTAEQATPADRGRYQVVPSAEVAS